MSSLFVCYWCICCSYCCCCCCCYKSMLHKWNFVLNTTKKVCKEENENDEVKKCRYKKTHTHSHVYLHEWSTLTNSMHCQFCPWTASILFLAYELFLYNTIFAFELKDSLNSDLESNFGEFNCRFLLLNLKRIYASGSDRWQFCVWKRTKPCETALYTHMIANMRATK